MFRLVYLVLALVLITLAYLGVRHLRPEEDPLTTAVVSDMLYADDATAVGFLHLRLNDQQNEVEETYAIQPRKAARTLIISSTFTEKTRCLAHKVLGNGDTVLEMKKFGGDWGSFQGPAYATALDFRNATENLLVGVECGNLIKPMHTSFTGRSIQFENIGSEGLGFSPEQKNYWPAASHLYISKNNFSRIDHAQIEGGFDVGQSPSFVDVYWTDERSGDEKDKWLLVIGALFGLAAACLIEVIRPGEVKYADDSAIS